MLMNKKVLALDGGTPVRNRPMGYQCVGGNVVGEEEMELVREVLENRTLFRHYGPNTPHMVDDFEREVGEFLKKKYVLATSTGSGSFFCAASALEWGPGDEVIIPTYGWITSYSSVALTGAVPVFAEIDESLCMSPEAFEKKITSRTKAVMVIHYQGGVGRLEEICRIAGKHGIAVFEDSAQTWVEGKDGDGLHNRGIVSCFSLQAHKMITAGDGGVFATDDQRLFERAVRFHDLGLLRDTFASRLASPVMTRPFCGMQWRMGELSGAAALAQMRKLPDLIQRCRTNWQFLRDELADDFPGLKFRAVRPEDDAGILLAFDLKSRGNTEFFARALEAEGLVYGPTSYCQTMDRIEVIRCCLEDARRYRPEEFTATEELVQRYAKLAVMPVYTADDMRDIAEGTKKVLHAMQDRSMIDLS